MHNVFFSGLYIENVIVTLQELLSDEIDNVIISDSTYINDDTPSIQIHIPGLETFLLFLPNSFIEDPINEKTNSFHLILDKEYANITNVETFQCLGKLSQNLIRKYYEPIIIG